VFFLLAARLAANARALVQQRYDWHTIGRRFLALVEETVQAQRPLSSDGS